MATGDASAQPGLLVLSLANVGLYRIPPVRDASGHFAADWGVEKDVGKPGSLKVFATEDAVYVKLFHDSDSCNKPPKLFATCVININKDSDKPDSKLEYFVQGVNDSSRYFAVRIVNQRTKQHAYVGIGFQSRESAMDLRATLGEEVKRIARKSSEDDLGDYKSEDTDPKVDHSLKPGERIKINLDIPKKLKEPKVSSIGAPKLFGQPIQPSKLIAPPAAAGKLPFAAEEDDDDFGEFQ